MFALINIGGERARRPNRRAASGFTLIELILVMTLLAIMSLTVTPVFRGSFSGVRADHSMRDLLSAMKGAQSGAITQAVEHRVYFEPEENRYWVARAIVSEEGGIEYAIVDSRDGRIIQLPRDLAMERPKARRGEESGTYYIAFYPSGACDIARLTVALADDSRSVYAFETTGTTIEFEAPQT